MFLLVGLPYSALSLLGERACDVHAGPPCTVGWGTTKLITLGVAACVCMLAGWFTNVVTNYVRMKNRQYP